MARVLGVCGFQNSGKTSLLVDAVPRLVDDGLRVAVVKHDAHGISLDPEGKDSDRLFRAGADVWLQGPDEVMARFRPTSLEDRLERLLRRYDVVLVEGHKGSELPKVWLERRTGDAPPSNVTQVQASLAPGPGRANRLVDLVNDRLREAWLTRRRYGGVLLGGASRRMGRSKADVRYRGRTFLDLVTAAVEPSVDQIVRLGAGPGDGPSLPDAPGVEGPLGGLLAATRWARSVAWVVAACDLPLITREAVAWLENERRPGLWAIVPRLPDGCLQPLLAVYEPLAGPLVEAVALTGGRAPTALADHPKVATPIPPPELCAAWTNVNTRRELDRLSE